MNREIQPYSWIVLLSGMFLSATAMFVFGRDLSFTVDEYSLVSLAAQIDSDSLLAPYVGHLVALPLIVYRVVLEMFSAQNYAVFQILTLLSLWLLALFFFLYARRRLPDIVALAPAFLLMLFPTDYLHYLFGNGFIIVFALAMGLGALYFWERGGWGNPLACLMLCAGALTYTVAIPFLAVITLLSLLWRRRDLWVGALPLLLYLAWRTTIAASSVEAEDAGINLDNLALLPAWSAQALEAILLALSGWSFDFHGHTPLSRELATSTLGGALLGLFLLGIFARYWKKPPPRSFWAPALLLLALFASQLLVWGSFDQRTPTATRYLYPGATLVLLLLVETWRETVWHRSARIIVWLLVLASISVNFAALYFVVPDLEARTERLRAEWTVLRIADSGESPIDMKQRPRSMSLRKNFSYREAGRYGDFSLSDAEISSDPIIGRRIDRLLLESYRIRPREQTDVICEPWTPEKLLPLEGKIILRSNKALDLRLGRVALPARSIGKIEANRAYSIQTPQDAYPAPWLLRSAGGWGELELCQIQR